MFCNNKKNILFNVLQQKNTFHLMFCKKIPLSVKCFAKKERRKINMCHVGFPGLHSQILNKSAGEDLEMQEALNLTSSRGLFAVCIKTTKSQHWLHCRCNKHAPRTDHNLFHLKFSNSHPTLNWFVSLWACCHIACSLWTMFSELKEVAAADATTGTGESSKEFVDCCSALHQRREYQLAKRHHQSAGDIQQSRENESGWLLSFRLHLLTSRPKPGCWKPGWRSLPPLVALRQSVWCLRCLENACTSLKHSHNPLGITFLART